MIERLGKVLYWACCLAAGIAGAIAVAVLFGTQKVISIFFVVIALVCYGLGRAIRYVLVGR